MSKSYHLRLWATAILFCSFKALASTPILAKVALAAEEGLAASFYQPVTLNGLARCVAQEGPQPAELIFGNRFYGYQSMVAFDMKALRTETIRILPPGYRKPIDFYCRFGGKVRILGTKSFAPPQSAITAAIRIDGHGHGFTPPFLAFTASLAIPNDDFMAKESASNIGVIAIANRYGEIIWAHVPKIEGEPLATPIRLEPSLGTGFVAITNQAYAGFNLFGEPLYQGKYCSEPASCPPQAPFVSLASSENLYLVKQATGYLRSEWQHFLTGPEAFLYPKITAINLKTQMVQDISRNRLAGNLHQQQLVGFWLGTDDRVVASDGAVIDLATGNRLERFKILALAKASASEIAIISQSRHQGRPGPLNIEWLAKRPTGFEVLRTSALPSKQKWFTAHMTQVTPTSLIIAASRADPSNIARRKVSDDIIFEWDFQTGTILAKLAVGTDFYSQMRNVLPLAGLPGCKFLGSQLAKI